MNLVVRLPGGGAPFAANSRLSNLLRLLALSTPALLLVLTRSHNLLLLFDLSNIES